eukprot:5498276-Amphidinium_carterae.1
MLKVKHSGASLESPIHTDLLLKDAMLRRALAYDQVSLVSYTVQAEWVNHLFRQLHLLPPDGYKNVTTQQLLAADQQLFLLMSAETQGQVKQAEDGSKPLDVAMRRLMFDYRVAFHLQFLQGQSRPAALQESGGRDRK